jgi:hypothetical protein
MRLIPLLLLPVLVSATPFRPADLPSGSAWFLHVDHDAVRSAPLGASLMSQPIDDAACPLPPKAKAFLTETGFDYRRDLRAITVFGSGAERQASILVRHSADDLKVGEFLRKQGAKTTTVEGAPCLAYDCGPDGNECTLFIAFPQPGVIAIGMSAKDLGLALRSLESERAESALPTLAVQEGITSPSVLAAVDMVACAEANPRWPASSACSAWPPARSATRSSSVRVPTWCRPRWPITSSRWWKASPPWRPPATPTPPAGWKASP